MADTLEHANKTGAEGAPLEPHRPNVIWVFGDQHRAQALGCAGDPNLYTPNLDRLAAEGVHFTNAVATSPLCCPARGTLLTSRYAHECVPGHEDPLPAGQPTVAHVLKEAGYHTAYFGKWHLDGFHESSGRAAMHVVPSERRAGFETWMGYENNNSPWDSWVHGGEGGSAFHERLPGYETDELTGRFIAFLRTRADASATSHAPFFAVLSVQPPHDPYVAPAGWMGRHTPGRVQLQPNVPAVDYVQTRARRELAGYYAATENLDWNVGRIRAALASFGLEDTTHIVFFSDHGDLHGSHGQFRKTAPWEEAIRVPLIISGTTPYYGKGGGRQEVPCSLIDIAPTTLGLCGLSAPSWMRGTDLSGYRLPDRPIPKEPDSTFFQLVRPTHHPDSVNRAWRGVVTHEGWKYVVMEGAPWLMFNLADDPYELVNVAHEPHFATERHTLHERLARWLSETNDPFRLLQG